MRKIQLPKETVESLVNGATKFIIPISKEILKEDEEAYYCQDMSYFKNQFALMFSPLRIGDKFYVQEEVAVHDDGSIFYLSEDSDYEIAILNDMNIQNASQVTYEQSRLKDLVVVDVEIKRVQDINVLDIPNYQTQEWEFDNWYNKQYNNYNQNPYVFIITIKGK